MTQDNSWVKEFIDKIYTPGTEKEEDFLISEKLKLCKPLYKYCYLCEEEKRNEQTVDYSIENLIKDEVFFQKPEKLNDPFDCYVGFSEKETILKYLVEGMKERNIYTKEMHQAIINFLKWDKPFNRFGKPEYEFVKNSFSKTFFKAQKDYKKVMSGYRVSCFSEKMDSPLMWSHYANKHYGFCLEYDFTNIFDVNTFDLKLARTMLFPVIYSRKRPMLTPKMINEENIDIDQLKMRRLEQTKETIYGLLFKSKEWSYEKEWRIIKTVGEEPTMKLPPAKKIYLGINIEENAKSKIIQVAKNKSISVFQMVLAFDKYKFDYYRII